MPHGEAVGTVRLVNHSTLTELSRGWELQLEFRPDQESGWSMTNLGCHPDPGESGDVELPKIMSSFDNPPKPARQWRLKIGRKSCGFMFGTLNGQSVPSDAMTLDVKVGDVVVVIPDPASMPLSPEENVATRTAIVKLLEQGRLHHFLREEKIRGSRLDKSEQPLVWRDVCALLFAAPESQSGSSSSSDAGAASPARRFSRQMTPSQLKEIYDAAREKTRVPWKEFMRPLSDHQQPSAHPGDSLVVESIDQLNEDDFSAFSFDSDPFRIEVYWRALDRFPGGNCDTMTLRYSSHVINGCVASVSLDHYSNWDGSHSAGSGWLPNMTEALNAINFGKETVRQLRSVVQEANVRNAWSPRPGHLEWNIVDEITVDNEEFNTEWSSIEVLVYSRPMFKQPFTAAKFARLPDSIRNQVLAALKGLSQTFDPSQLSSDLDHLPSDVVNSIVKEIISNSDAPDWCLLRCHQSAAMGPQFAYGRHPAEPAVSPSEVQRNLMDFLTAAFGVVRPEQQGEQGNGDPRVHVGPRHPPGGWETSLPYVQPIYFRFTPGLYDLTNDEENVKTSGPIRRDLC